MNNLYHLREAYAHGDDITAHDFSEAMLDFLRKHKIPIPDDVQPIDEGISLLDNMNNATDEESSQEWSLVASMPFALRHCIWISNELCISIEQCFWFLVIGENISFAAPITIN